MVKKGDPGVLRYVVRSLRLCGGQTQSAFGKACGIDQSDLSRFERGEGAPVEEQLRRMAEAAGVPWTLVPHMERFFAAFVGALEQPVGAEGRGPVGALLEPVRLALAPHLLEEASSPAARSLDEERREAGAICAGLRRFPAPQRRRLLAATLNASRSPALVVELCEVSVRAAADEPTEALSWAELALTIADQVKGERKRARLQGYARGFRANALRVLEDHVAAADEVARSWASWAAGSGSFPELLPEWRLLDLEASLRREQHRFADSLELLERARAGCTADPVAQGRILLKKEHVLAQMGDFAGALAALTEAAPWLEGSKETRLLCVLRFNQVDDLYHLERYREAAALLPQVRELAVEQENELDLVRLKWLEARVAAGLGQSEEAMAGLEQVQQVFTDREMPYDAALSSLDLAVLWLESGRRAEVRELAVGMAWIFKAKGIHREALAALRLFEEAVRYDKATAGLARQVIAEIEKVRRTAPPLPKKEGRKA
jgi:transcriptional regulator with XRE-family HTH domain